MKNDSGFPLEEQKPKPFEDLTFHDDFMFGIVMQDREICREALECMLGMQIARVDYAEPQRSLDPLYTAHGVRLDVYVQDSDRVYDVEIRLPYGKPMSFRTAETHEGQTVRRPVRGVSRNVRVSERGDAATVHVLNCRAYARVKNPKLRAFMKYVQTDEAESEFTRRNWPPVSRLPVAAAPASEAWPGRCVSSSRRLSACCP